MTNLCDWSEDFGLENGNYYSVCSLCGGQFLGHKRRVACKCCDTYMKRPDPHDQAQRERIAQLSDVIKGAHVLVENHRQQLATALRERDEARAERDRMERHWSQRNESAERLATQVQLMTQRARQCVEYLGVPITNPSGEPFDELSQSLQSMPTWKEISDLHTRLEAAEKNMREIAAGNKYLVRSGGLGCLTDDCDHWDAGCEIGTLCHIGRTIDVAAIDAARETK